MATSSASSTANEVVDLNGRYLGQIRDGDRLVHKQSKAAMIKGAPGIRGTRGATSRGTRGSRSVPAGYSDFPR